MSLPNLYERKLLFVPYSDMQFYLKEDYRGWWTFRSDELEEALWKCRPEFKGYRYHKRDIDRGGAVFLSEPQINPEFLKEMKEDLGASKIEVVERDSIIGFNPSNDQKPKSD